jgi:very-short-patch-repair endonuclease
MTRNGHPSPLVEEGGSPRRGETEGGGAPKARALSTQAFAKKLRRGMTEPERKLWWGLRGRQLEGFKFRRQVPLGPYVADFCCLEAKLIVEVDGGQHAEAKREHDEKRTAWLATQGYRVLRFWNYEVLDDPLDVCAAVLDVLKERIKGRGEMSKRDRVLSDRRRIYSERKT